MGYRHKTPPMPDPESMLPVFDMFNHESRTWSIPCFYLDVEKPIDWHDPKCHDHHGWPRPDMPDWVCNAPWEFHTGALSPDSFWQYVNMDNAVKIHLTSEYEGYTDFDVVFDPYDSDGEEVDTSSIKTGIWVRQDEDWIVDILFKPALPHFADKPKEFIFNAYAATGDDPARKDLIVRGKLVVLPG